MVKYNITCHRIAKVFIIIPKSCSFPAPGTQFEHEEHIGPLEPVVVGFRKYFLQLYKITTSKGKVCDQLYFWHMFLVKCIKATLRNEVQKKRMKIGVSGTLRLFI